MRFVDRETELKTLSEIEELSKRKLWITAIYGARRNFVGYSSSKIWPPSCRSNSKN